MVFIALFACTLLADRLFEVVETLGRVHLVTEWIQGGELYYRINQDGPLKEIYASGLFKQLLSAVKHMVKPRRFINHTICRDQIAWSFLLFVPHPFHPTIYMSRWHLTL